MNRQAPCPSRQTILIRSPRRPRKINKVPSNGSRFNVSCTRTASPGNPFSCRYGRSLAKPARRSGPGSSTHQNIKHATSASASTLASTRTHFHRRDRSRSGLSSSLRVGPNAGALLQGGRLNVARCIGWNQTQSCRLAKLLRSRLATPGKDQTWSDPYCAQHQIPLRQPQTSPQDPGPVVRRPMAPLLAVARTSTRINLPTSILNTKVTCFLNRTNQ